MDRGHGAGAARSVVYARRALQIGKNTNVEKECAIRGCDLLELAYEKLRVAQKAVGGKLVLIEREGNREKLLQFYKANGFKSWNSRYDENDRITYDQMIRVLEPISDSSNGGNDISS